MYIGPQFSRASGPRSIFLQFVSGLSENELREILTNVILGTIIERNLISAYTDIKFSSFDGYKSHLKVDERDWIKTDTVRPML